MPTLDPIVSILSPNLRRFPGGAKSIAKEAAAACVPRGTTTDSGRHRTLWPHGLDGISTAPFVPRETSCIPTYALLDFRYQSFAIRGIRLGPNHRHCQPKGRRRQNHHGSESRGLPCHSGPAHTPCGLRFSSQLHGCHRFCERSFSPHPLPFSDSQ